MSGQAIRGSVAFVTGANRGIGRAIVEALLARGARKVYASARKAESVADLVALHPGKVEAIEFDVTSGEHAATLAHHAPDVTLLVNNAGIATGFGASIADPATLDWARAEIEVNYLGTLRTIQAFAPVLGANGGGSIVNMSSVAGISAFPPFATYSASKAALRSLTQAARVHLAQQGTQVVGVYPGPVDTAMAAEIPFDKTSPTAVAGAILDAVEAGVLEVYPDPFAADLGQRFEASPSGLERHVQGMVSGAAA